MPQSAAATKKSDSGGRGEGDSGGRGGDRERAAPESRVPGKTLNVVVQVRCVVKYRSDFTHAQG